MFFRNKTCFDHGNKYFKKRKLFKETFAEDYLSRNNRALNNLMTRMFVLVPNLTKKANENPRFLALREKFFFKHNHYPYSLGGYVNYYKREWNKFLRENIDESTKKFNSPFKKGETYDFKLKKKDDLRL